MIDNSPLKCCISKIQAISMVLALVLCGCTPGKIMYDEDPQLVASPDKASMLLAQAADRASTALETLAAVEQTRTPAATVTPIPNAPEELMRAMTINWVGPVEPVVKKLADHSGYRFTSLGAISPVPLVVTVNVENTPIIDILRSVGLQLGLRADLKVDAEAQIIEINYAPNTGVSGGY
jgi:defect-in-organelle-trafficking protein DotD